MHETEKYHALACIVQCPNPDCTSDVRFSIDETLWSIPQTNALRLLGEFNENTSCQIRCKKCNTLVFMCRRSFSVMNEFKISNF
jgi:hypothetical protein